CRLLKIIHRCDTLLFVDLILYSWRHPPPLEVVYFVFNGTNSRVLSFANGCGSEPSKSKTERSVMILGISAPVEEPELPELLDELLKLFEPHHSPHNLKVSTGESIYNKSTAIRDN
ncbi:hypothetical protein N8878_07105, partial [Psychromonas sp.]|nr:hypothetical protein [Psychromonas sp.]